MKLFLLIEELTLFCDNNFYFWFFSHIFYSTTGQEQHAYRPCASMPTNWLSKLPIICIKLHQPTKNFPSCCTSFKLERPELTMQKTSYLLKPTTSHWHKSFNHSQNENTFFWHFFIFTTNYFFQSQALLTKQLFSHHFMKKKITFFTIFLKKRSWDKTK